MIWEVGQCFGATWDGIWYWEGVKWTQDRVKEWRAGTDQEVKTDNGRD